MTIKLKQLKRWSLADRQRGVALITVMLILALIAILATQMTARLQLQMQRTTNIEFNQQAYWYAMGAEAFAKRVLTQSFQENDAVTHLGQVWAQGETTFPVDYGEITGEITDLHACFNLNALRNSEPINPGVKNSIAYDAFKELVIAMGIEGVGDFEAEYMADALTDWLDADESISNSGGAEDSDYASREFPYLAANNYIASFAELRIIEHFNVAIIEKLKEFTCILPNTNLNKVNVNTIADDKPEILVAMLGISEETATEVLANRSDKGFESIADFFDIAELRSANIPDDKKKQFTVASQYFKFKAQTNFNNSYFALNTIMKVENKNKINVISRIIGRE